MTFTRIASVVAVVLVALVAFGVYAFAQSTSDVENRYRPEDDDQAAT